MKLTYIFKYSIIIIILLLFILYDTYLIEESFEMTGTLNPTTLPNTNAPVFSDNIYDAKVNSLYVHDENNNVRQVLFDVNVPLNRYYVQSTATPAPTDSEDSEDSENVDTNTTTPP